MNIKVPVIGLALFSSVLLFGLPAFADDEGREARERQVEIDADQAQVKGDQIEQEISDEAEMDGVDAVGIPAKIDAENRERQIEEDDEARE